MEAEGKKTNYVAQWDTEFELLKAIMAKTPLVETVKWGAPTYTFEGKNIAGIWGFKSYVGMWFHNGVFLKDTANKLVNAQDNVTKALRQWRFSNADEIRQHEPLILQYLAESIENHKAGLIQKPQKKTLSICDFLQQQLNEDALLKVDFEKLSPTKQREFAEYISEAKREPTKVSRFEKIKPMIHSGTALNDKYK